MLLTPMTYEGLLDALIGMDHGVVSFEKPATGDEELTSETERVELYTVNSETLNLSIWLDKTSSVSTTGRESRSLASRSAGCGPAVV